VTMTVHSQIQDGVVCEQTCGHLTCFIQRWRNNQSPILQSHYGYRKQRKPKPKRSQRDSTSIVKFSLRFMCVISAKLFNPPCLTKNVIAPETSYFICYCMFFCRLIICFRAILSVYVHYIFLHSAIPSISISYYDFFYNTTSPIQL